LDELDPEDLRRLQCGDPRGLEAAFRVFGDRVYRTAHHLLGQAADAEDAAQEVFLRLRDKARLFGGRASLSTWIYRLTVNHCLNLLAARRRGERSLSVLEEREHPEDANASPSAASERREAGARATALLARLAPEHRAVLALREIEELSYDQIAEALDVPVGTVMSRLARARERLARITSPPHPRAAAKVEIAKP
jgi:RNA polymerase sigma-70 factor (ECF subfamily)